MTEVRVREAHADDLPFLWDMLLEAAYWHPDTARPSLAELQGDMHNSIYMTGWGRDGDLALIAEAAGERIGAAWYRLFNAGTPGYGFVDVHTPEVSIALRSDYRGAGVGTALLTALIDGARRHGFHSLSLSVAAPNPALHLYERLGFERVSLVTESWTMLLDLRATRP